MIIYYIDFEFLILVFHYCLEALYNFYTIIIFPQHYYVAYNQIKNFPITNNFGTIPYEFWDEYPLLSATPYKLYLYHKLKKLPKSYLHKNLGYKFALDLQIYLNLR
jgi:hypothetical protein